MSALSPTFPDDDTSSSNDVPATSGDDDAPLRPAVFSDSGVSGTPEQVVTYNALNDGAGPDPTADAGSSANPYGVRAGSYVPGGASYVDFDGTTGVAPGGGYLALSGPPPSLSESPGAGAPPSPVSFQPPHTVTPAPDIQPAPSFGNPPLQSAPAMPPLLSVSGRGDPLGADWHDVGMSADGAEVYDPAGFSSPDGPDGAEVSPPVVVTATKPSWWQHLTQDSADVAGKLWGGINTMLGLDAAVPSYVAGQILGTHPSFKFGDNALQLINSPWNIDQRPYTLGNVQIYGTGAHAGPNDYIHSYTGAYVRNGAHEAGHSQQAQLLGPLFLPAELVGTAFGDKNPLEVGADKFATGKSSTGF